MGPKPFAITGEDTIIAVSPFENTLFTCESELVAQLVRDAAFVKPNKSSGLLNVSGLSLTGTDGQENKHHRKIAAPFFRNQTIKRAFHEILGATEFLLHIAESMTSAIGSRQLRPILAKLVLHILEKGAFDKEGSCLEHLKFTETLPKVHKLSWVDTWLGLDQLLPLIALTPPTVVKYSPLPIHRHGHLSGLR